MIPSKFRYVLDRVYFEYKTAIDNLAFMLDKNSDNPEFLNSETYKRLQEDCIACKIQAMEVIQTITDMMGLKKLYEPIGDERTRQYFLMIDNDETYDEKDEIIDNRHRVYEQFGDWIVHMYPELHREEVELSQKNVLTKTFTFQVTDKCNLACTYCYQINKSTRRLKIEDAKLAVDKLLSGADGFGEYMNVNDSPAIIIEFIGGEPFLEIDLIDEITDYFREQAILLNHPWATKYCISICSNGILYTDPKVQNYLNKNKSHLSFSVTVDGVKELHDSCRVFPDGSPSYDIAHGAALDWMKRGNYMGSKITIAPDNITYLADSLEQMIRDGYYDINANCVYENVWKDEHATELYKQVKKFVDRNVGKVNPRYLAISLLENNGEPIPANNNQNWCGGTGLMLSIDPDGYLYPCIRYMESSLGDQREPLRIGDVHTGIMSNEKYTKNKTCLDCVTRRSQSTNECWFCAVGKGCGWCSAYNYQINGNVDKRCTFHCKMHKARALATVYYKNMFVVAGENIDAVDLFMCESDAVEIIGEELYKELVEITKAAGKQVNETGKKYARIKTLAGNSAVPKMQDIEFMNYEDLDEAAKAEEIECPYNKKTENHFEYDERVRELKKALNNQE